MSNSVRSSRIGTSLLPFTVALAAGCLMATFALGQPAPQISLGEDELGRTLREYSEQTDLEHVRDQPAEQRQQFYAKWLSSLVASLEKTPASPFAKSAKITICSLHNGLGMLSEAERDCVSLAAEGADDGERVKWYVDAAELALDQVPGDAGRQGDADASARADGYLSKALKLADAQGLSPTEALFRNYLRAIRMDARLKANVFGDADSAVALLRKGRAMVIAAPVEVAHSLDGMFAGTEALSALEAEVLAHSGKVDEALQAVDAMSTVKSPKQPRSFYADRVAAIAAEARKQSRASVLRIYLSTREPDGFTPAARHNLAAALLQEGSTDEAIAELSTLMKNNSADLRAIDDRSKQAGYLAPGAPGWAESAGLLMGLALAKTNDAAALPYLEEFAAKYPQDPRAAAANAMIQQLSP